MIFIDHGLSAHCFEKNKTIFDCFKTILTIKYHNKCIISYVVFFCIKQTGCFKHLRRFKTDNQKTIKNVIRFFLLGIILFSFGCAHYLSKDFKNAALKLNTPQLIDEYQRQNFSYATTSDGYGCGGVDISYGTRGCSPSYIYYSQKGNCAAYTTFAVYCLRQAGYKAYPIKLFVKWPSWFVPRASPRDYHYAVLYNEMDKWYIMEDATQVEYLVHSTLSKNCLLKF